MIDGPTAVNAFGLGVLLVAMCPKNRVVVVRGGRAEAQLDAAKGWHILHNGAVMTVLFVVFVVFVVFGVDLVSKGLPPLGS